MVISRTYLDSYYPLAIILGDRHESEVRDVLYRLSKSDFEIIIPQRAGRVGGKAGSGPT